MSFKMGDLVWKITADNKMITELNKRFSKKEIKKAYANNKQQELFNIILREDSKRIQEKYRTIDEKPCPEILQELSKAPPKRAQLNIDLRSYEQQEKKKGFFKRLFG